MEVDQVYFEIGSHYQEGDWRSEFPPYHELDMVKCTGMVK